MARHINQRPLSINKANIAPRQASPTPEPKGLADPADMDEISSGDGPQQLGAHFQLLFTGQFRAGGRF